MPINFKCNACGQVLQVGDQLAGQLVACPKCGNQQAAPGGSGMPPVDFSPPFSGNPYEAPSFNDSNYGSASSGPVDSGTMTPVQFDVGSLFSYCFELWKRHLGLLVGIVAVGFGISMAHTFIDLGLTAVIENVNDDVARLVVLAVKIVLAFGVYALGFLLQIGQVKICLKLLRGEPADFGMLFKFGDVMLPVFGVSILMGMAMFVGFLLLIIPGLLIALFFWPTYYFVLDRKAGVFESFSAVLPFTKVNVLNSFVIFLIATAINILGLLACCVGVLFSMPLAMLVIAGAYLAMTGQLRIGPR